MAYGANGNNVKMARSIIATMMMVMLGGLAALATWECVWPHKPPSLNGVANGVSGFALAGVSILVMLFFVKQFPFFGLLVTQHSDDRIPSALRSGSGLFHGLSVTGSATVLESIWGGSILLKVSRRLRLSAVAAAFRLYNIFSHDVNLPKGLLLGQGRAGSQLLSGSLYSRGSA